MTTDEIPETFKSSKIYNWDGIFYYKNQPCKKVDIIEIGIVRDHYGDRAGSFDIHDTGYIFGRTLCGYVHLRIEPVDNICPNCGLKLSTKAYCANLYHKS